MEKLWNEFDKDIWRNWKLTLESMLITSPKNDEEVFNIEVSDNYRDESDLKIPLGS